MVNIKGVPGLGSALKSSEDVLALKEFLKSRTDSELEQIASDQVDQITAQYLLVNRLGSAFGRIFIDATMQAINSHRFEAVGYSLYTEKPFSGDLHKTLNYCSESFWSCSCKESFIHHTNQMRCKKCGVSCAKDTKRYQSLEELTIN
jgi:hypothetical protein